MSEQAAAQAKAAKDDGAPLLDVLEEDDEFEVRLVGRDLGSGLDWVGLFILSSRGGVVCELGPCCDALYTCCARSC